MKAKVIGTNFEEYGQIIDVVLNQYMGKYTDGKKLYPKESLSFEIEEKEEANYELSNLAFQILFAKESASVKLGTDEDIDAKIEYAYNVAKRFQEYTLKTDDEDSAEQNDAVESNIPKIAKIGVEDSPGLSDILSQLETE